MPSLAVSDGRKTRISVEEKEPLLRRTSSIFFQLVLEYYVAKRLGQPRVLLWNSWSPLLLEPWMACKIEGVRGFRQRRV